MCVQPAFFIPGSSTRQKLTKTAPAAYNYIESCRNMRGGKQKAQRTEEINMFLDESDNRNPRERVDENLLRRIISDNKIGESEGGQDYNSRHANVARGVRNAAATSVSTTFGGGNSDAGCCASGGGEGKYGWNGPEAGRRTWGLAGYPLGSTYAPLQEWRGLYDLETGYNRGTIFRELDLPFLAAAGTGGVRGGNCRG
jgi:hypothetical protein